MDGVIESKLKLPTRVISLIHELLNRFEFCTEHGNISPVLYTNFRIDWATKK